MSTNWLKETRSTEKQVVILAADTSNTSPYLSDQLIHHFGTTDESAILGIIGDDGRPFQAQFNDYLDSL